MHYNGGLNKLNPYKKSLIDSWKGFGYLAMLFHRDSRTLNHLSQAHNFFERFKRVKDEYKKARDYERLKKFNRKDCKTCKNYEKASFSESLLSYCKRRGKAFKNESNFPFICLFEEEIH